MPQHPHEHKPAGIAVQRSARILRVMPSAAGEYDGQIHGGEMGRSILPGRENLKNVHEMVWSDGLGETT